MRMKIIAALALVIDVVFMGVIGLHESNEKDSFAMKNPGLYKNLTYFGLRIADNVNGKALTVDERMKLVKDKLFFTAAYLIMSILINRYFMSLK
jgi:hypothetical protein